MTEIGEEPGGAHNALADVWQSLQLLATRRYGVFWASSFLSNIGTWAQQVAEPWLLIGLGATPFLIGLDSFAQNAPVWGLTLLGGWLADRADRRRVIALFQTIQMACPLAIVALIATGRIHIYDVIAISAVVGVTDALSMPSFQSITPSIVEIEHIDRGLALNSTQFNLSRIVGPAVAGIFLARWGAIACFVANALSYLPFIGVALWILPKKEQRASPASADSGLLQGMREAMRNPMARGAIQTALANGVLCMPLVTFAPVLVHAAFAGTGSDFSVTMVCLGAGGLSAALAMLAISQRADRRRWSSYAGAVAGLALIALGAAPSMAWLPPLMIVAGFALTLSGTSANTVLQASARPQTLGRTVSLFMLATRGGSPLGAFLTGLSAEFFGVRSALIVNGCLALLMHLLIGRQWRKGRDTAAQPQA